MKNKTILSIAILAISLLIIPQMTFASWWKPNTWKIFNKKAEVKIERTIVATSTPNNVISQTEKATTTPTASRSSDQSVGAEKIEQKKEEGKKNDQSKEIEKLKKEVEALKQKQAQFKIIEKTTEKPIISEKKESSSSQTKQNENIVTLPNGAVVEMDANGNISRTIKEAVNVAPPSPKTTQTTPPPTTTQITPPVAQPTTIPTPTPTPPPAPKIEVSISSNNSVGKNILKGEKNVVVLGLNIENSGGRNIRIDNLKIKLVGTSFSNFQDLKIKIGGQLYSAVYTNGDVKTYNPGYTLDPNVPIQVLVQADVALTANNDSFHVEIIEVSGVNTASGEGAKSSDVVTGNTFTFYQPTTTNASPAISTATDISFLTNTDDVGAIVRFDAKNNPFSILKIILTFSGVDELDINNVKLLIGGNVYYKLYPTSTYSANGQKVAYIERNKIIFQNFSPYELFHVNRNVVLDLVVLFEMKPTAFWKTLQIDIPNPLIDITAFDWETGLILPVSGSSIGNQMTVTNKKYYNGY